MYYLWYILIGFGIVIGLFCLHIFIVTLDTTIKEFRASGPTGMDASMGFGGELGIKHKKKAKT
jgi:hypothetical protein